MSTDEKKMARIDVLVKISSGIVIPLLIFLFGTTMTLTQKRAEAVQRKAAIADKLRGHLKSNDVDEKIFALRMLDYFVEQDEFPEEFAYMLGTMLKEERNSEVVLLAGTIISKMGKTSKEFNDIVVKPTMVPVLAEKTKRVYVHIFDEKQRSKAKELGQQLIGKGYEVPGVERIVKDGLKDNELRFFKEDDAATAQILVGLLEGQHISVKVKNLSERYKNSTVIRPGHFELWFSQNQFM